MTRSILIGAVPLLLGPAQAQSPGGVGTNLQLWLRAEGYTGGTTWTDASGNARHAAKVGTVANTLLYNFQNVPTNLNNNQHFRVTHHANLNANNGAITVIAVGRPGGGDYQPFVSKTNNAQWEQGWVLATSIPISDLGFTTGNWDGVGTTNVAKQSGVPTNIPYIASGFGNGATTNVVSVCHNGTAVATNTSTKTTTTRDLFVGYESASYHFNGGSIAEVLVYNANLSATDRQRVWSYLAVKYGITLNNGGTNYVSSNSTVIWNTTTNNGFNANIFGIGRDNTSGLHQRQSISIHGGPQPVIGHGTTLVALNSGGTNLGTDQSFLMAGSDNGAVTFTTGIQGISGINARLGRIWRVQETGTVGTVTVAWPDNDPTIRLLVSNDAVFDGSDMAIATSAITINGTAYRQANVDLANGQYFTFGALSVAPGGRFDALALWLASDAVGVTPGNNAPNWPDLSKNNNPVERIGTRILQAADAGHNFHPFFNNFSANDHFKDVNSSIRPATTVETTEISMFAVARLTNGTATGRIMGIDDENNKGDDPGFTVSNARPRFDRQSPPATSHTSTMTATTGASSIFSAATSGTSLALGVNGNQTTHVIGAGGGVRGQTLMIGQGTTTAAGALPGDLQEVIWYKRSLSATERRQVESYLCLKHGITYGGNTGVGAAFNYLNSSGGTTWDKALNDGYNNDITGIGRDDASRLDQRQSTNASGQGVVTMALGGIAASNAANTTPFTNDLSFLIGGHDGGATTSVFNDPACFQQLPSGVEARIQRKWKVQATNFTQAVTVAFDQSALLGFLPVSNLRLLVDDDGIDWTNATVLSGATSAAGRIVFSGVTLGTGLFFTLATVNVAGTPLPVELVTFQGEVQEGSNHLRWSTATESFSDRFELERSEDAASFERIASLPAAGYSLAPTDYAFTDLRPAPGIHYYRLKQVDQDGSFSYSPVVVLRNEAARAIDCLVRTLESDGLYLLQCNVGAGTILELFNAAGQPLSIRRSAGEGAFTVDLRTFAPGVYIARIREEDRTQSYRLLRPW